MTAESEQALARHQYQAAKMQADSWARIIAQDVLKALDDWRHLPTRKTLEEFKAAEAAEVQARAAWDRADARVAS